MSSAPASVPTPAQAAAASAAGSADPASKDNALTRDTAAAGLSQLAAIASGEGVSFLRIELAVRLHVFVFSRYANWRHGAGAASAQDLGLTSIDVLSDYAHLQDVDLHGNELRTDELNALRTLRHLTSLDVSANKLTQALAFPPPLALLRANFASNRIARLGPLDRAFGTLQVLVLDSNSLTELVGLQTLTQLSVLSLRDNQLTSLAGLAGLELRELYLGSNRISNMAHVETLTRLEVLDLSHNALTKLAGLGERHTLLQDMALEHNLLASPEEAAALRPLRLLRRLSLTGNAHIDGQSDGRMRVLFLVPQVRLLDGVPVSAEELVASVNRYAPPEPVLAYRRHCVEFEAELEEHLRLPEPL